MDDLLDLSWLDIGFEEIQPEASSLQLAVVPFATPLELLHSRSLPHTFTEFAEDPSVSPANYLAQHEAIQDPHFHLATVTDITEISTDDQLPEPLEIRPAKRSASHFSLNY
jgi:hypothetical protein